MQASDHNSYKNKNVLKMLPSDFFFYWKKLLIRVLSSFRLKFFLLLSRKSKLTSFKGFESLKFFKSAENSLKCKALCANI